MASKEATVYIVDVGLTMGERSHGRTETNLEWALAYVWDKITTTVGTGRKTAMAGVVTLRTDDTKNELQDEDDYNNISVVQEIAQLQMPELRKLRRDLTLSSTESGDAVSALILAIQMIVRQCKKLQYVRKIVLVTDARAPMQTDDLSQITTKIKEDSIELVVLGVDFDDADFGFKEEDKDSVKASNEGILRTLCDDCNGAFGTLAQAIEEMQIPRVKTTKPVPSFKGFLTLGDAENTDGAIKINVERYPKTMGATAPTASQFVVRNDLEATQSTATLAEGDGEVGANDGLAAVKNARTYQVEDDNAPGGKRDVDRDELSKGYEYGRTAVHIAESDQNVTLFETSMGMEIIGFVAASQYDKHMDMSRSAVTIPERSNEKAYMALSSFLHALHELDSYAVARLTVKDNKEPRMILLMPSIEPDLECFYDVELPFAEDVRSYKFPPLDRVVTVSGKELTMHRNLPSEDLQDAMSAYVDSMDLSEFGKDDEGQPSEYAPLEETFSPKVHRINQVIKHRAIFPDAPPPEPYEILTRYSRPPEDLVKRAQPALDNVIKAADVKRVPPKARGKRFRGKNQEQPLSNLDIGALLAQDPGRNTKRINPKNAGPEFKQMFIGAVDTGDEQGVREACDQLRAIVFDLVRHSMGNTNYAQVLALVGEMRKQCLELDFVGVFNDFLKAFKQEMMADKLGEGRRELWYDLRKNNLRPITKAMRPEVPEAMDVEEADALMLAR